MCGKEKQDFRKIATSENKKMYNEVMSKYLWDYDRKELEKTENGRIKILERMINYGPEEGEKIPLAKVREYWDRLRLELRAKQLMELLIWGKIKTQQTSLASSEPYSQLF